MEAGFSRVGTARSGFAVAQFPPPPPATRTCLRRTRPETRSQLPAGTLRQVWLDGPLNETENQSSSASAAHEYMRTRRDGIYHSHPFKPSQKRLQAYRRPINRRNKPTPANPATRNKAVLPPSGTAVPSMIGKAIALSASNKSPATTSTTSILEFFICITA